MDNPLPDSPAPTPVASIPPPTPPATSETRNWLMGLHLSPIVAIWVGGIGAIVAPLVIWLIKKTDSPEIDAHGKLALNFQISCAIYALVGTLLCATVILIIIGGPLLLAVFIVWLYGMIKAAVDVNKGAPVRYPVSIPFLK